jgi:mRNA interferase HigB
MQRGCELPENLTPKMGVSCYNSTVRIISRKRLIEFWQIHPDAEQPLRAWYTETKKAKWRTPTDVKTLYRNASILPNNRVVFNIKGNVYRLVVVIEYRLEIVFIRFVGTHQEYDKIDATMI